MAKTLSVTHLFSIEAKFTDEIGTYSIPDLSDTPTTTNGTGTDQADCYYQGRRTVADSSTPDSLDLTGGLYGFGPAGPNVPLTFVEVTHIVIINRSAVQTLTVGGGTNPVIPAQTILPRGRAVIGTNANPAIPVANASTDTLKVQTDGGTVVPYDIAIAGRSA